ncbi:hypothetical protein BM536_038050 [Streptomyces phaeoluteigriseus]|uniref:Uncharacterized protein n=1 Tax=Streptomyces phaeoluteigriseus TaxID=114686 RepID=A0A1V6MH41_9ACTN|nr:hypothetical protein BM536_038050 [Streptomyces phaeoluteigriseus]
MADQGQDLVEARDAGPEDRHAFLVESTAEFPLYEAGGMCVQQDQVHACQVRTAEARGKRRAQVLLPQLGEPVVLAGFAHASDRLVVAGREPGRRRSAAVTG